MLLVDTHDLVDELQNAPQFHHALNHIKRLFQTAV